MSATLRPSTLGHYQKGTANYVIPYLGQKTLTKITATDLRKLYDTLGKAGRMHPRPGQSRGLSSTTVHGIRTGLRRGEICGLMWSDFDERGSILKVSRTLHREKGGRLVAGDTKTYAGTRKIVLPPSTAELFRVRKKNSFSPWIFHDPLHPEAPISPDSACQQLKKLLADANLPNIRFHDLRHTYATIFEGLRHFYDLIF